MNPAYSAAQHSRNSRSTKRSNLRKRCWGQPSRIWHISSRMCLRTRRSSPSWAAVSIAKGEILPDLWENHEAFQHAVFDKFASECAGQLPIGGKSKEELLHLLAAVQPVDERAPAFDAAAPAFLGLRSDQILRNVLALEETGIVLRTRGAARIVPDVLRIPA